VKLAHTEVHLTQEQAEALCLEWQETLRLQHWDIKLKIARGNGLDLPEGLQGRCEWVLKKRSAFIRLINPMDWDKTILWPQDMERTLVHELLHLHFAPFDEFPQDSANHVAAEQAIDALSLALVNLKRKHALDPLSPDQTATIAL
jgi:hypothetical protein